MVKNKKGGSKHKRMARKNISTSNFTRKLRKAEIEGEMYARVLSIYGGGHAAILCADNKNRTLVIRGKFRGRNKRDNTIKTNSIVLVALRSVSMGEVVQQNKKEKADLIYVYNQSDMDELKNIPEVYAILNDTVKTEINDNIDFVNEETVDLTENIVIKDDSETTTENKLDDVEFDWDDI